MITKVWNSRYFKGILVNNPQWREDNSNFGVPVYNNEETVALFYCEWRFL